MPGTQRDDVEETVDTTDFWDEMLEGVADVVEVMIIGFGMVFLILGLKWLFGLYYVPPAERFITYHPGLATGIASAVTAVVLCIKKLKAASRTGVNGDGENGDRADVVEASRDRASVGSGGAGEHGRVQPTILTPPAVMTIPSPLSSRSGGGVSAGSGMVTAADVELGAASNHQRGERDRGVDISGEAIRDGKQKNA
ncbi:hypothetical protein COCNU_02G000990 [Cocos nucifera]|uniref:Uncharacterized protein n=1 Tax=Cocos nucifera TaxID=13894 RepID=A0A8K0HXI9_COCNU|nr:hypothetical protein COCNU_02G000990 [Cocos nucifera]